MIELLLTKELQIVVEPRGFAPGNLENLNGRLASLVLLIPRVSRWEEQFLFGSL